MAVIARLGPARNSNSSEIENPAAWLSTFHGRQGFHFRPIPFPQSSETDDQLPRALVAVRASLDSLTHHGSERCRLPARQFRLCHILSQQRRLVCVFLGFLA